MAKSVSQKLLNLFNDCQAFFALSFSKLNLESADEKSIIRFFIA
jgi:hypothetical protein